MMNKLHKRIKLIITRLLSINDKPKKIAYGYALGIFLATTPFIGCKVLIAIIITYLFKWNRIASIIGVLHVNSLTGAAFYGLSYFAGNLALGYSGTFVFPDHLNMQTFFQCFAGSRQIFMTFLVGGLIFGIPLSIVAYKLIINILKHRNTGQNIHTFQATVSEQDHLEKLSTLYS